MMWCLQDETWVRSFIIKNMSLLPLFPTVLFFLLFVNHFSVSFIFPQHCVTLSFSHPTFSPSSFPPQHSLFKESSTRTQLPKCLSLSFSVMSATEVRVWIFLSSSNTAVLHRYCNSSSACNSRPPSIRQVICPPPHRDEETMLNLPVTYSHIHYMFSLVIMATACLAPARHTTDH